MIINIRFGYAARHQAYYDTDRKRGTLRLWSPYSGSITGAEPIEAQEGLPTGSMVRPGILARTIFKENQQTEFAIADEQDLLSVLAALAFVRNGAGSSFMTREGRRIRFSLKRGAIEVKIQYGKAAILTVGEAHKLQTIAKEILRDLGCSEQEISERLKRIPQGSPN